MEVVVDVDACLCACVEAGVEHGPVGIVDDGLWQLPAVGVGAGVVGGTIPQLVLPLAFVDELCFRAEGGEVGVGDTNTGAEEGHVADQVGGVQVGATPCGCGLGLVEPLGDQVAHSGGGVGDQVVAVVEVFLPFGW